MIKPRKLIPGGKVAAISLSWVYSSSRHHEEGLSSLPIVTQMDFGHTDPMCVLPYGVMAQIDCEARQLEILESAVTDEADGVDGTSSGAQEVVKGNLSSPTEPTRSMQRSLPSTPSSV